MVQSSTNRSRKVQQSRRHYGRKPPSLGQGSRASCSSYRWPFECNKTINVEFANTSADREGSRAAYNERTLMGCTFPSPLEGRSTHQRSRADSEGGGRVVTDRDREHARILSRGSKLFAFHLNVVVKDSSNEWRDQSHLGFGAGNSLGHGEKQRQVAVNAVVTFEDLSSLDA